VFALSSDAVDTAETESNNADGEAEEADASSQESKQEEQEVSQKETILSIIGSMKATTEEGSENLQEKLSELVTEAEKELDAFFGKNEELESQLASVQEEVSKFKEQYLRLNADFDNFRKRTATEKDGLKSVAQGNTLEELLPVIDNFDLASSQLKLETEGEEKVSESYQGLYRQMVEVLKKLGLETIDAVGSKFDPEIHDAVMQEETQEHEDATVLEEFRRGFKFKDRLLRPAMVKVAVNSEAPAAGGAASDTAGEEENAEEEADSTEE